MKKIVTLLFMMITLTAFGYINIYPTEIIDTVDNGGMTKEIELYNGSSKPRRYRIYFDGDNKISKWGEVSPKGVTLLPGEKQEVKVEIKSPKKVSNGRYVGVLTFKEVEVPNISADKNEKTVVYTEYHMPVIAYVGKKGVMSLPVDKFEGEKFDFFDIKGNQMVYSIENKTYVREVDTHNLINTLPYRTIKRMVNYYLIEEDGKLGIVGLDVFTPYVLQAEDVIQSTSPDIFSVKKNGKYALYKYGSRLTANEYDYIGNFKGNYGLFMKNKKYGIINLQGKEIVPAKADEIYFASNGNWIAKIDGEYQTSKFKLKINKLIPTLGDYPIYEKNGKFGLVNIEKMKFIEANVEEINPNVDHGVIVSDGKKYGIATITDLELKKPVEYIYDLVGQPGGDTFSIVNYKTGKYSYYNVYSGLKTPDIYDVIIPYKDVFMAERGQEADIYSKYGRLVATVDRDRVIYIGEDIIVQKKEDNFEITDMRGEE